FDWFHTVYAVALTMTAAIEPISRMRLLVVMYDRMRCTSRNQHPCASALIVALNRLMRTAGERPNGASSSSHARASSTNSGLPGGCGMPTMWAVAIYSLVSQNHVVGLSVQAYSSQTPSIVSPAASHGTV